MTAAARILRRLRLVALVALVALGALFVPTVLRLTAEATHASAAPAPAALAPLTRRLVFIVVDALRHDYGSDPALAPHFARAMQEHASGVVWAGRITMTAAAVLSFATGTRGTFSQVLLNIDAERTSANHLFDNARAAGLTTGIVGDPVWVQAYGHFDVERLSEQHLALDADDTPELFAAADALVAHDLLPPLTVMHFFASDHMGHVHGVFSQRFRDFFLRFDAALADFLARLPRDTTVFVLSDHGALDNGNHGVDSELERKTPFFAYGPGIRPGVHLELDQVDVAPTLAALLGIASPAHGLGAPARALLALDDEAGARLACAEAERITRLAAAQGEDGGGERALAVCRDGRASPAERADGADAAVRAWDERASASLSSAGLRGFAWALAALALFGGVLMLIAGLRSVKPLAGAMFGFAALTASTTLLTLLVDRAWDSSRALTTWLATALAGVLVLAPRSGARLFGKRVDVVASAALGLVFVSYPIDTQLQGAALCGACVLGALGAARAELGGRRMLRSASALLAIGAGAVVLVRLATAREDPLAAWLAGHELEVALGLFALWLGAASVLVARDGEARTRARRPLRLGRLMRRLAEPVAALGVGSTAFIAHVELPAAVALGALALLPAAALLAARRRLGLLARACLFAAYGLVARPIELSAVLAAMLVAEGLGWLVAQATAGERRAPEAPRAGEARLFSWSAWSLVAAAFALAYLVRIGAQRGLDFENMDWNAGSFDSHLVSHVRIAVCLVAKYALACSLPAFILLGRLGARARAAAAGLLAVALVLRFGAMAAVLAAPRVSFWARYRMVGELGPDAIMALVAIGCALALPAAQTEEHTTSGSRAPARGAS